MKFEHLAGKRALGSAHARDYTAWAESLLREGIEDENIVILASIGLERDPDSEEVQSYFQKSLRDLGLSLPPDKDALRIYATAVCEQILSGDLGPEAGADILAGFYAGSDYESIYSIWDGLSDDLWLANNNDVCIFNTGLTRYNSGSYIKDVASQFIVLLEADLPDDFFHLSACPECGYVGRCELEIVDKPWMPEKVFKMIYRRGQTQRAVCPNCDRSFPNNMSDYEGRRQYLDRKC